MVRKFIAPKSVGEFKTKVIDHARDKNDNVVLVGDYVHYVQDLTSQRVDKIVLNYGGAVLFLQNGLRVIAHECFKQL